MKPLSDYMDFFIEAPCYLGFLFMADKFCKKYLGASRKKEWLFVILSFGSHLALNIIDRWYSVPYIYAAVVYHILFTGLILLFFRESWEKKILAASVLMAGMVFGANFFVSLLSCLVLFFQHTVKMIPEPFLNEWEGGGISCASFCFVILAVYWMSGRLESVFCGRRRKWYAVLAIPLLLMIAVFDVAGWGASCGIMVRSGGSMGLYYDQIFSHAEFLVLAFLSASAAWVYVSGMNRIYLEQEKSGQYHSQIAVYKMLAEQYRQSERLRHDMKNHIIVLSALYENKEWEKMGDYLENMKGSALDTGGDITGNKAVDALLHQKRKRAEEENIRWECDVQIPKGCGIQEFDLCILFGNILDNALEACKRMPCRECRFIHIQAKAIKRCFIIEVKNSMDIREKNAEKNTKKRDSQEHGIGLQNVGDVVHKYNGVLDIKVGEGIFVISVLLPLKDTAHTIKTAV